MLFFLSDIAVNMAIGALILFAAIILIAEFVDMLDRKTKEPERDSFLEEYEDHERAKNACPGIISVSDMEKHAEQILFDEEMFHQITKQKYRRRPLGSLSWDDEQATPTNEVSSHAIAPNQIEWDLLERPATTTDIPPLVSPELMKEATKVVRKILKKQSVKSKKKIRRKKSK